MEKGIQFPASARGHESSLGVARVKEVTIRFIYLFSASLRQMRTTIGHLHLEGTRKEEVKERTEVNERWREETLGAEIK